jgi:transcriptional regulator with XRE-family HTH domain
MFAVEEFKDRILKFRKELNVSQKEFGRLINLSANSVCRLETGKTQPKPETIERICKVFSLNSVWLKTGEGKRHIDLSRDEELRNFMEAVMSEPQPSFRKRLFEILSELSVEEWALLEKISEELIKDNE